MTAQVFFCAPGKMRETERDKLSLRYEIDPNFKEISLMKNRNTIPFRRNNTIRLTPRKQKLRIEISLN
jgi:hypothetical protein